MGGSENLFNIQCCIYVDIVGGSEKVNKSAEVIYGLHPHKHKHKSSLRWTTRASIFTAPQGKGQLKLPKSDKNDFIPIFGYCRKFATTFLCKNHNTLYSLCLAWGVWCLICNFIIKFLKALKKTSALPSLEH